MKPAKRCVVLSEEWHGYGKHRPLTKTSAMALAAAHFAAAIFSVAEMPPCQGHRALLMRLCLIKGIGMRHLSLAAAAMSWAAPLAMAVPGGAAPR
jgi:hypothetical protein